MCVVILGERVVLFSESTHVFQNILYIDPSSLPVANALEGEGITNAEDLVLLADEDISNIIVDRQLLKILYQQKLKNVIKWYHLLLDPI